MSRPPALGRLEPSPRPAHPGRADRDRPTRVGGRQEHDGRKLEEEQHMRQHRTLRRLSLRPPGPLGIDSDWTHSLAWRMLVAADIDHLAPTSRVAGCAQGVPIIPAILLRSALGYEQPLS